LKFIKPILTLLVAIALMLFFNGNLSIPGVPLPALAKFLHPTRGVWNNGDPRAYADKTLKFPEVSGKAEVIYDERLVPHIYAQNIKDALFLQGYVEAENRLFQMDFMTRAASGRLSEVLGIVTIPIDKERLRSQIDTAAGNAVASWLKTKDAPLMQAYVDGVNKYISNLSPEDYPYEYKLLGFAPEPWTMKKSALVYKSMADQLAGNSYDLEYSNLMSVLGKETFDKLYPEYEDGGYPVIGNEKKYGFPKYTNQRDTPLIKTFFEMNYKNIAPGIGSNNWAVSSSKTADGSTILCNDPHLGLSIPSIWIEEHINIPGSNTYGVSFPGFPGIMIGFNDDIAWGETNVGHDVEDMFMIKWVDNSRKEYWLDGKKEKADWVIKTINVKGLEPILDTLIYTKMGIIKLKSNDAQSDLAVRWLAVDTQSESEFMTFIDIMQAKNVEQYKTGLLRFNTPAQNFLFASKSGEIGLTVNGKLPLRQEGDGRFVESGTRSSNDWDQYIPRDQNPQIFNPKAGYVVSANQRSASKDYPYYYTGKFEHYRNRVINDSLISRKNLDVQDMMKLQANSHSMVAKGILPVVFGIMDKYKIKNQGLDKLRNWNYSYDGNKVEPVIFDLFYNKLYKSTFDEIETLKDTMDVMNVEHWVFIHLLQKDQGYKIFDLQATADKKEVAEDIVKLAIESYEKEAKPEDLLKTWDTYRPVDILHYTRIPALSKTGIKTSGVAVAPNAMQKTFGPSWRMVVKYGKEIEAYGVFPGGQSGNPLSKFYANNVDKWAKNEYYALTNPIDAKNVKSIMKYSIN
jgi:penicillin G amidase